MTLESRDAVWEVFARKEYADPLHHVGTVTEEDEDWRRLRPLDLRRAAVDRDVIVPRSAIREAIRA